MKIVLLSVFLCILLLRAASARAAEAKTYPVSFVSGEIRWESLPVLPVDQVLWEPDAGIRAAGQFGCSREALFVHLQASESEIRATYTAPLSPVYQDSCLEFFFMPEGDDRYFNFEINANGCLYIGFGHGRSDSVMLCRENMKEFFQIKTARTADGWEVFYQIPLSFLRVFVPDFEFSGNLRANVYKCGDKTVHPHYLSWNPVTSDRPDFHRPQDFGVMVFPQADPGEGSRQPAPFSR